VSRLSNTNRLVGMAVFRVCRLKKYRHLININKASSLLANNTQRRRHRPEVARFASVFRRKSLIRLGRTDLLRQVKFFHSRRDHLTTAQITAIAIYESR